MKKQVKLTAKRLKLKKGLQNTVNYALLGRKIDRNELMTYHEFIKSDSWKYIKKAWYKRYGKFCVKCNSTKYIHLHHIVYPILNKRKQGRYRKVLDKHFLALCKDCHKQYHDENGVWQDMINSTIEFVGRARYNKVFSADRIKKNRVKKIKKNKRKKYAKTPKVRKSLSASDLLSF